MEENSLLLAETARLYYEENLNQSEVGKQLNISRSKVSRLLKEAKEIGIVEININYPLERSVKLEQKIKSKFNLNKVMILKNNNFEYEETLSGLGNLTANYIDSIIEDISVLGLSWGKTIYNVVNSFSPNKKAAIKVVQIIGSKASKNPTFDAPDLIRKLATAYGGNYYYLHAPLYIEDDNAQKALMNQPAIMETISLAKKSDVILTGIGSLSNNIKNHLWNKYLEKKDFKKIKAMGAVGHICAHFYDINGNIIPTSKHNKILGIDLNDLHQIETVVGIAGGESKFEAILGALRGNYLNILVTDDSIAQRLINI